MTHDFAYSLLAATRRSSRPASTRRFSGCATLKAPHGHLQASRGHTCERPAAQIRSAATSPACPHRPSEAIDVHVKAPSRIAMATKLIAQSMQANSVSMGRKCGGSPHEATAKHTQETSTSLHWSSAHPQIVHPEPAPACSLQPPSLRTCTLRGKGHARRTSQNSPAVLARLSASSFLCRGKCANQS